MQKLNKTRIVFIVIVGLALSTLFTLVLVPALFSLTVDARRGLRRIFRRPESRTKPGGEQEAVA